MLCSILNNTFNKSVFKIFPVLCWMFILITKTKIWKTLYLSSVGYFNRNANSNNKTHSKHKRKSNLFRCFVQTNVNIYFSQTCYFRKMDKLRIPVGSSSCFSGNCFSVFHSGQSELLNSLNIIETSLSSVGSSWLLNIKWGKNVIYNERYCILMLTLNSTLKQTVLIFKQILTKIIH